MVEPTESEPREELDRFCEAMIAIRREVQAVIDGTADPQDKPPQERAPHRQRDRGGSLAAPVLARGSGVPAPVCPGAQVLATCVAHQRCVR